jgi:PIN domain nuclease of toxin-antitoxin system
VRLLLDTHPLLWWVTDSPDLSAELRQAIADRRNNVHVSVVSLWEIAIKTGKGKLNLYDDFDRTLDQEPFARLAILTPHVRAVRSLPHIHADPFDRLLIAQARVEGMTLVTRDKVMRQYEVPLIAA